METKVTNEELQSLFRTENFDYDLFIKKLFTRYVQRMKNKEFSNDEFYYNAAKALINLYYRSEERVDFQQIVSSFKRKYILNENNVEDVHNREERAGLGVLYDYIQSDDWYPLKNILAALLCQMNSILYSKVPNRNYGGSFRNVNAYITDSDIATEEYSNIINAVYGLNSDFCSLYQYAEQMKLTGNYDLILDYINACLILKCKLIRIHPFLNGNGRTMRALLNLMFRWIELPPVYIRMKEREAYIKAMDDAIRCNHLDSIQKFYYHKICESILELGMKDSEIQKQKEKYS